MASLIPQPEYPGLPLNLEDEFRLIDIQPGKPEDPICCSLFTTRARDSPNYEALSYTWGNPDDKQSIQCRAAAGNRAGHLLVTQNCASALRRLRLEDSPRTVWIDSICIDQNEVTERNHQLGLMAKIYTQAEQVVIHLGEASEDSDSAIDWLRQIDDPDFSYEPLNHYDPEDRIIRPEIHMLESLFNRPWFNRIWVLQEAVLSKSAVVYCGQKTISWDAVKHFKQFNVSAKWVENLPYIINRRQITPNDAVAVEFQVLTELLRARHCEATDPRDKIYALLPLLSNEGINPDIIPDYGLSVTHVYTAVATYLLNKIGLELLSAIKGRSQLAGLPSWVPDWSIRIQSPPLGLGRGQRFWSRYRDFRAGGEFVIPGQTRAQDTLPFTLQEVAHNGIFSAHIKTKAIRLGKISGIGDPCPRNADIPPFRLWKSLASTLFPGEEEHEAQNESTGGLQETADEICAKVGPAASKRPKSTVTMVCGNDRLDGKKGDLFVYTVVTGNVVYSSVVEKAVQRFVEDDGSEASQIPVRKWLKGLPPSYKRQVEMILEACRGRRFLIIDAGYMGLAPLEAESGDLVFIIPGVSVPFVMREENGGFRLVGECYVQNVMDGEVIEGLDASQMEEIIIH
jgi:hypothetical protein